MANRRTHRENYIRGRLWLVFIFLFIVVLNVLLFFTSHPMNKGPLIGGVFSDTIWSLVLLAAIWIRKDWARYFMVSILLLVAGLTFIFEIGFADTNTGGYRLPVALVYSIGHAAAAIVLIASPSIRKLTSRSYE